MNQLSGVEIKTGGKFTNNSGRRHIHSISKNGTDPHFAFHNKAYGKHTKYFVRISCHKCQKCLNVSCDPHG